MSKLLCPVHDDVVLVKLHINAMHSRKNNIPSATKFWYCHKCKLPYEIYTKKSMVLLTTEIKKPRKIRSDKGTTKK